MLTTLLATLRSRSRGERAASAKPGRAAATVRTASSQGVAPQGDINPYMDARREWNERYGDYIQQAQHWRTMAIISGIVALIAVSGVGYIGAQSKVVPYIVEVDKLGGVAAVAPAERTPTVDPRILKAYLARFVSDWRTVTVDRQAQKSAIDRVYAMLPSGSVALSKVNEYFTTNNPFEAASKRSVGVAITNLLPISERTWQVEWQETTRNTRGEVQSTVRMKVSIIVGITPPTDESLMLINPLGVYVTDLNWSRQF